MDSYNEKIQTPCGSIRVEIGSVSGKFSIRIERISTVSLFTTSQGNTHCNGAYIEALENILNILFANNIDPNSIIRHLRGIRCEQDPIDSDGIRIYSCIDAVGRGIEGATGCHNVCRPSRLNLRVGT